MVDVANSERAIPETKGPRLEPFSPKNARIRFKRLISDPEADESHGFVFEVTVGRQSFALKVVSMSTTDLSSGLTNTCDSVQVFQRRGCAGRADG